MGEGFMTFSTIVSMVFGVLLIIFMIMAATYSNKSKHLEKRTKELKENIAYLERTRQQIKEAAVNERANYQNEVKTLRNKNMQKENAVEKRDKIIRDLKKELADAKKNDHRNEKGQFAKAPVKPTRRAKGKK